MSQLVSITSQGQLTIPKSIRDSFGIKGTTKATIKKESNRIIVKPQKDFWELEASLKSKVKLTDKQLETAREAFAQKWPQR